MRTRAPLGSFLALACTALVLPVGLASAAVARECDGISFPEHIQARGETLTLNGLGLRKATVFGIKVYVGALYLTHPTADTGAIPAKVSENMRATVTAGLAKDVELVNQYAARM